MTPRAGWALTPTPRLSGQSSSPLPPTTSAAMGVAWGTAVGGPQGPGPERQTRESDLRVQLLFALMSPFPCPLPNTLLGSLSKLGAQSLGFLPSCLRRGLTQAPGQGSELLPLRETLGGLKLVPHVPQTDSNPPPHTDVLQHRRQNAYETLFTKPEC